MLKSISKNIEIKKIREREKELKKENTILKLKV